MSGEIESTTPKQLSRGRVDLGLQSRSDRNYNQVGQLPQQLYNNGCDENVIAVVSFDTGEQGHAVLQDKRHRVEMTCTGDGTRVSHKADLTKFSCHVGCKNENGPAITALVTAGGKVYSHMDGENALVQVKITEIPTRSWCTVL